MLVSSQIQQAHLSSHIKSAGYNGTERRLEHRRRLLKGAVIKYNCGYGGLECVLRNITSTGARISMGQTNGVPSRVQIHVVGEQTPIEAQVQWRTPREIGLSFLLKAE